MDEPEESEEVLSLRPSGRLMTSDTSELLGDIRRAPAGVELDLSAVDSLDLSMLQLIVVVTSTLRQRGHRVVITDSEDGVLRSALELSGIRPELAGLSARFAL